ncbi:MAG: pantetheine-phosphate adenylyltransferase [Legionellales bacterium RIFCSPHIGHO2_12_FULL_37_14]|nr:MAG: pantetheine-phosphate adenylyltransferase [Legionellales bacterium RIFCSPHIGHO2_12_FULL_37_14]
MNNTAIFPGSFDPITNGHINLIKRACNLYTNVIVGVAKDTSLKKTFFSYEERLKFVAESLKNFSGVTVKGFSGLLVDFYQAEGACSIIRGLRSTTDFGYEKQLFNVNKLLLPGVEMIFLMATKEEVYISASMVRELALLGKDISAFVPGAVVRAFKLTYGK